MDRAGAYGVQDYIGHIGIEKIEDRTIMFLVFQPPNLLKHLIKLMSQYKNYEKLEKRLH